MRHLAFSVLSALLLCPSAFGQILTDDEARTDRLIQQDRDETEDEIQSLESRLSGIENDLYQWRNPTASEVETMRENWTAANPLKTSFDMPDFASQKIRILRTDAAANEMQATAESLQVRIAKLEAKLGEAKRRESIVTPVPTESPQKRETDHEYAVQAEIDRQKRNAMVSEPSGDPLASQGGLSMSPGVERSDSSKREVKRDAAYDRAFAASAARAAKLYSFFSDPTSDGGKRMLEIESDLLTNNDPLYYDPNKPLIIAQMVAKELRIAPRHIPITENEDGTAVTPGQNNAASKGTNPNELSTETILGSAPTKPVNQSQIGTDSRGSVGLKILVATYGADSSFRDVTSLVQIGIQNGSLKADSNSLGGDPIFGKVKTLKIVYEFEGQILERDFAENSKVQLQP